MKPLRIGTRDSQLAVWQATLVQSLLKEAGVPSELVYIKSEGDIDTVTPLYALGVTGVFTKTLDAALLNNRIDIAVHSMKDVPTQLAQGIKQAAVLKRASNKDIFVAHPGSPFRLPPPVGGEANGPQPLPPNESAKFLEEYFSKVSAVGGPSYREGSGMGPIVATGSIRRVAQWLHRFPSHHTENLRGNVNTRLRKLEESNWNGAIFAAAGLERINLRPENSIDLDWMLPAPSQGAIMIVCRESDTQAFDSCQSFNDEATALCTKIEKDFLRVLMGGCSTPISALAQIKEDILSFHGNICSPDGVDLVEIKLERNKDQSLVLGEEAAHQLLADPKAQHIMQTVRNGKG
jgi:hydroxymethylbilane synthase